MIIDSNDLIFLDNINTSLSFHFLVLRAMLMTNLSSIPDQWSSSLTININLTIKYRFITKVFQELESYVVLCELRIRFANVISYCIIKTSHQSLINWLICIIGNLFCMFFSYSALGSLVDVLQMKVKIRRNSLLKLKTLIHHL